MEEPIRKQLSVTEYQITQDDGWSISRFEKTAAKSLKELEPYLLGIGLFANSAKIVTIGDNREIGIVRKNHIVWKISLNEQLSGEYWIDGHYGVRYAESHTDLQDEIRIYAPPIQPKIAKALGGEEYIYRIRKLTERECFRLMDVSDSDIDKMFAYRETQTLKGGKTKEIKIAKSNHYKLAGNSIVVAVLERIFENLLYPPQESFSSTDPFNLFNSL